MLATNNERERKEMYCFIIKGNTTLFKMAVAGSGMNKRGREREDNYYY